MEIPRQLIYKERTVIDDFGINKEGAPNKKLYDEWLLKRPDLYPEKSRIGSRKLKVFNDAYFMCTLLLLYKDNCENALPYLVGKTEFPSVVIPMVYYYLSNLREKSVSIKRLMTSIVAAAENNERMRKNLDDIIKVELKPKSEITFKPCEITEESLSKIHFSVWEKATNYFSEPTIKIIIKKVAKKSEDQLLIAEAIKIAAIEAERAQAIKESENNGYDPIDQDNWEDVDLGEIRDPVCITDDIVTEIKKNNGLIDFSAQIETEPLDEETRTLKSQATDYLKGKLSMLWNSDFIIDSTYDEHWRDQMTNTLMNTVWGTYVAKKWKKDDTHNTITCSLIGVLCDRNVFKKNNNARAKYSDLAKALDNNENQQKTYSCYMSHKKHAKIPNFDLTQWLTDYLETPLIDEFPTESNDEE